MTITIRYYERLENFEADYNKRIKKEFCGETARNCMKQVSEFRRNHDLSIFTPTEIVNVED